MTATPDTAPGGEASAAEHAAPPPPSPRLALDDSWIQRFRAIAQSPKSSSAATLARAVRFRELYAEFEAVAADTARALVACLCLARDPRDLTPAQTQALAVAQTKLCRAQKTGTGRYVVDGILYKFERDWRGQYGGDDFAAKMAGNALRALRSVAGVDGAGVMGSMVTLVDYRGFRVRCVAVLPIDADTLVYGSTDWGRTVRASSAAYNSAIRALAQQLHLKPHVVGGTTITTPCDLEGHIGRDGQMYLIDPARIFPPEAPLRGALFVPADPTQAAYEVSCAPWFDAIGLSWHPVRPAVVLEFLATVFNIVSSSPPAAGNNTGDNNENGDEQQQEQGKQLKKKNQKKKNKTTTTTTTTTTTKTPATQNVIRTQVCPVCSRQEGGMPGPVPVLAACRHVTSVIHVGPTDVFCRECVGGLLWWVSSERENARAELLAGFPVFGDAVFTRGNRSTLRTLMLRPELMQHSARPLSSDAWSPYACADPLQAVHDAEVVDATRTLLATVVPDFASRLNRHLDNPVGHRELSAVMHTHGINMRYLGCVRMLVDSPHIRSFLLMDMLSRVIKNDVRALLRSMVSLSETDQRKRIVDYFNLIFGECENAAFFWSSNIKTRVQAKFVNALTREEAQPDYDLRQNILFFPLLYRVCEATGVTFKLGAYNRLFDHPFLFNNVAPLSQVDFEGFKACTKNTAVMCEDISSIITLSVAEEEQESIAILEQVGDQQAMSAFQAVQQLKIHRRIELIFGADSKEAIASHYVLAQKHLASGNTMMALDAAIKGLAYSEVLFGPFSEISLQGNVQLGEIYKRLGDIPRAIEYYRAALTIIQGLYKQHPLVGTLTADIFFCTMRLIRSRQYPDGSNPLELLKESFRSFSDMFDMRAALLLLPLVGFSQNDPMFVHEVQDAVQKSEVPCSILSSVKSLWPDALYEQLEAADTSLAGVGAGRKSHQGMLCKEQQQVQEEEDEEEDDVLDGQQHKKAPRAPVPVETSLTSRTRSYGTGDPYADQGSLYWS